MDYFLFDHHFIDSEKIHYLYCSYFYYSFVYYNQSITFTLAPIEEYSVEAIVSLVSLNKIDSFCKEQPEQQYYSINPEWLQIDRKNRGCFDERTTQKITNYFVINNSEIRQVGDSLKNLDTKKQDITIIAEIENDTLFYSKINVTKTNETDVPVDEIIIYGNEITGSV